MKSGKFEEKIEPMFPRLHVNDTDKGGPRAPPRNKMALYEQLSTPLQASNHSSNPGAANLSPSLSQGGGSERSVFFSHQLPLRHQSESHYNPHSGTSMSQVEHKKKFEEDDFTVPIFNNSFPSEEYAKYDKLAPSSNLSFLSQSFKFQKPNDTSLLEVSVGQERENQKQENSKDPDDIVRSHHSAEPKSTSNEHNSAVLRENVTAIDDVTSPTSLRELPFEDQNIVDNNSNGTGCPENQSCGADNVSETSILDSVSGQDAMTADDVVGILGQKHFWKARKVISNQQRIFAIQVFELHRLIKVQKLIASSPNILFDDSAYLSKPIQSMPKKPSFDYPVNITTTSISKSKGDSEKSIQKMENSAESTIKKSSIPLAQSRGPHSNHPMQTLDGPAPFTNTDQNPRPWFINQPNAQQWLIPIMSPSEGLVYKPCGPYPTPGYGSYAPPPPGSGPMPGNFFPPAAYGLPPQHPQYQLPTYAPAGPHGYYSPYNMPFMNTTSGPYSSASVDQMKPQEESNVSNIRSKNLFPKPSHTKKVPGPNALNLNMNETDGVEVQGSTSSCPSERLVGGSSTRASSVAEGRNVLPLFPMSSTNKLTENDVSPLEPEGPTRVIKVVPHNATSANESAARIFQFIQEERKQYD